MRNGALFRYRGSEVTVVAADLVGAGGVRETLGPALDALHARVWKVYVHLDLDILDPEAGLANSFASPGGLRVEEVEEGIRMSRERCMLAGAGVASYDPEYDTEGRVLRAGVRLIEALVGYPGNEKGPR